MIKPSQSILRHGPTTPLRRYLLQTAMASLLFVSPFPRGFVDSRILELELCRAAELFAGPLSLKAGKS